MSNSTVQATSTLYFEFTTTTAIPYTAGLNNSIEIEYPNGIMTITWQLTPNFP